MGLEHLVSRKQECDQSVNSLVKEHKNIFRCIYLAEQERTHKENLGCVGKKEMREAII